MGCSCNKNIKHNCDPTSSNYQNEVRNRATNKTPCCKSSNGPKEPDNK